MASVRRLLELPDLNMASLTADRGDGRSILDYFKLAQKMDRFNLLSGHMQDNLTTTFVRAVLEMERQSISTVEESIVNGARWRERYEDLNVETNENRQIAVAHLHGMGFGSVEPTSNLVSDFLDTTKFMMAMRPKTGFAGRFSRRDIPEEHDHRRRRVHHRHRHARARTPGRSGPAGRQDAA
jgi:hypothetical protein